MSIKRLFLIFSCIFCSCWSINCRVRLAGERVYTISCIQGDILKHHAQAIVSAANRWLLST